MNPITGAAGSSQATDWVLSLLADRSAPVLPQAGYEIRQLLGVHRLEPLAASSLETGATPGLEDLEGMRLRTLLRGRALMAAADRARSALEAAGVESLLFKGAGLLQAGVYADPGARPLGDVDLLVRPAQANRAAAALEGAGFRAWRPWSARLMSWKDSLPFEGGDADFPTTIDLHWRTEYGRLRSGEGGSPLWSGVSREARHPRAEPHLVVVAEHVLKHLRVGVHLLGVADAARLAGRVGDWDEVLHLGRERRSATALGHFFAALSRELEAPVPHGLAEALGGPGGAGGAPGWIRFRDWVGRSTLVRSRISGLRLRMRLSGSPRGALHDLLEAGFPGTPWLRARYGSSDPGLMLWMRYALQSGRWLVARGESPLEAD